MLRKLVAQLLTTCRALGFHSLSPLTGSTRIAGETSSKRVEPYVERLPSIKTSDDILVNILGNPPSMATIAIPPSIPINIRKNSLVMVQGNLPRLRSKVRALFPFKSFLFDGRVQLYEEITSTEPTSLIVSAQTCSMFQRYVGKSSQRSFASLELNGVTDWAILQKDALQVYGGPSLVVGKHKTPKNISRAFARTLGLSGRPRTGLSTLGSRGFTFIGGRGVAALAGHGQVFAIKVKENEEILINKHNLLSISVNGPHDLENCVVGRQDSQPSITVQKVKRPSMLPIRSFKDLTTNLRSISEFISSIWQLVRMKSKDLILGNSNFVNIWGPRTILLQSEASGFYRNLKRETLIVSASRTPDHTPEETLELKDYLNIVTCRPESKPTIESRLSFTQL